MESLGLILIPLFLGYLLGWWPNRNSTQMLDKHYNDMKELTNQFADLSAQLYNTNNKASMIGFPSKEDLTNTGPQSEGEGEPNDLIDLLGGRI